MYIFKYYHVNSMLSEKLLHNFKYFKLTILLGFFSPLNSTIIFKMNYYHVLPAVSIYQTMRFPLLLLSFILLFFFPLLQYSYFYSHLHPHKLILFVSNEDWNKIHKRFQKQRPGAGSWVPPDSRHVLLLVCSISPCLPCRGAAAQPSSTQGLSHTWNPHLPLRGVSSPSTRLSAQAPLQKPI